MFHAEQAEEAKRHVFVARRHAHLVFARPQRRDHVSEEVDVSRVPDIDEEAHCGVERNTAPGCTTLRNDGRPAGRVRGCYLRPLFRSMSIQSAKRMLWTPELRQTPAKIAATGLKGPTVSRR